MEITEQKAETKKKIFDILKTNGKNIFQEISRNNKTIYVAYIDLKGFLSFVVGKNGKTYAFIKDSLSEENKKAELQLIFDDNLHHFTEAEVNKINEILLEKRRESFSFKSIRYNDIKNINSYSKLNEYIDMSKLSKELDIVVDSQGIEWDINFKLLCIFKMGIIQGKREERAKHKIN